jgi:hypothetical protein
MRSARFGRVGRLLIVFVLALSSLVGVAPSASAFVCTGGCVTLDLRTKIVLYADGEVGTHETGDNCNPYGPCAPWCAMFARWTWKQGGATSVFSTNVAEQVATWGKNNGRWKTSAPRKGDIVVWSSGALDDSTGGHVGVIEYVDNGIIHSIDGNWNDAVTRRQYSKVIGTTYGSQTLRGFVAPPGAPLT